MRIRRKVTAIMLSAFLALAPVQGIACAQETKDANDTQIENATLTDADYAEDDIDIVVDGIDDAISEVSDETQENIEEFDAAEEETEILAAAEEAEETIALTVHQQSYGTLTAVTNGEAAGNVGTGKRLEGFTLSRTTGEGKLEGSIKYRAHCQSYGWMDWCKEGVFAGTQGKSKRLEAVQIVLEGELANQYDVYYRTYMSNCKWFDWAKNGEISGTVGYGATLEGIQVLLVKKGSENTPTRNRYQNITSDNMNHIYYSAHVQTYGDSAQVSDGATCGTTGKSKRLEAIKVKVSHGANQIYGTVKYKVHCQTYGWKDGVTEGNLAGTTGESKRVEAVSISLSGDLATYCDVYYRLHVQKLGWMGWAKNGENAGTSANALRAEAIQIKILPKGSAAPGSTSNAYRSDKIILTTSGYDKLAPYLDSLIARLTTPSMTGEQKLRAFYDYISTSYPYRTLSNDCPSEFKWYEYYAYQIVTTGSGNCYGFNSLMGELALRIGYTNVHFYKGTVGRNRAPHGWVTIDGYIYDPELKFRSPNADYFRITNGSIIQYYPEKCD